MTELIETKPWYQSKTEISAIIGFVAILLVNILPMLGINSTEAGDAVQQDSGAIVDHILAIVGGIGFIVAFISRFTAKKQLTK